ncbi:MAG TPA: UPF0158 family protein [Chthoniobacterales bacterium]
MKKLPVNLGDLELALEDQGSGLGLHSYWFDTITGDVVFLTEDLEEDDELRESIEQDLTGRFVRIEPIDSHEGFRTMAEFVDALPQSRIRSKLESCLNSKKPFRQFKDALYADKTVQDKWYQFNDQAVTRYAIEWLADLGIEPLHAAPARADTRIDENAANETTDAEQEDQEEAEEKSVLASQPAKDVGEVTPQVETSQSRADEAALEFVARRLKLRHPAGEFDEGGRFYPSEEERQNCCADIRAPSRAFPFSLMTHCRTAKHVARLYHLSEKDLRAEVEKIHQQLWFLCFVRDFDRVRTILEKPGLTVDPYQASPTGQSPRAILTETRTHGILKRQIWDRLFAALDDYEKRWQTLHSNDLRLPHTAS